MLKHYKQLEKISFFSFDRHNNTTIYSLLSALAQTLNRFFFTGKMTSGDGAGHVLITNSYSLIT